MKKITRISFFLLLILSACGGKAQVENVTQIRLPLGYIPDIQFAPLYVSLEKGYFAAEAFTRRFE